MNIYIGFLGRTVKETGALEDQAGIGEFEEAEEEENERDED